MATFSTYAEVLTPDHHLMKMREKGIQKQLPGLSSQMSSGKRAAGTNPQRP